MAKQQIDEDEELEEFEEDEEEEEEEEEPTLPKLVSTKKKPESKPMPRMIEPEDEEDPEEHFRNAVKKQQQEKEKEKQPEVQYVPVPRAVPIESMLNEIYDRQEQIIGILNELLKK